MENSLEVLKFLSTPFSNNKDEQWKLNPVGRADLLLSEIIEKCMQKIPLTEKSKKIMEQSGPQSVSWKFTSTILNLLLNFKEEIDEAERNQPEEEKSIEVLSLQAQVDVQNCVELLIGFGIVPYLMPGVGVPEKLRKKNPLAYDLFLAEDRQVPPLIQFHRLAQVLEVLLEIFSSSSLSALIIPKHAPDILAGLLQICNSPIAKPNSGIASRPGALSQAEYEYAMAIRLRLTILMDNTFLPSVPKSLLINSIFVVGATEKPKWIRNVCNEMMSQQMLSPNGLILISSTLFVESSASSVWNLARVIANLMKDALTRQNKIEEPQQNEKRLFDICSQCVEMIVGVLKKANTFDEESSSRKVHENTKKKFNSPADSNDNSFEVNRKINDKVNLGKESRKTLLSSFGVNQELELSRIGLFCAIVLMDINCQITKRLVWDHLFEPVLILSQSQSQIMKSISSQISLDLEDKSSVNEDMITVPVSVDIEKVMIACEFAEGLLSLLIPTDVSLPLQMFQPVWSLFFEMYVACNRYLERKVQEPNVAQLAQLLKSKLENILLLLLEVVSSGAGDKLDVSTLNISNKSSNSSSSSKQKRKSTTNQDKDMGNIINTISEERAKTVCEFCVQLLLNENENGYVTVHKFEIMSISSSSALEEVEKESVKIVCISSESSSSSTVTSGCQSFPSPGNNDNNAFELLSDECVILCSSILKHKRMANITSELFCQLLSYENESSEIEKENGNDGLRKEEEEVSSSLKIKSSQSGLAAKGESNVLTSSSGSSKELTQLEVTGNVLHKSSLRKFVALRLLSELGGDETIVEKCVKTEDYKETLKLVELIMRKLTKELKDSSCTGEDYEFVQSVMFSLGILGTVVETAAASSNTLSTTTSNSSSTSSSGTRTKDIHQQQRMDEEFWEELKIFIPHLEAFVKSNLLGLVNSGIPSTAENILMSIETKGVGCPISKGKVQIVSSPFQKALKDLANPMIPIKGHGLLQLRKLIEEKDEETLRKDEENLLQIFQRELINEDSYVYLMAVQGLASLGLKFHKAVVPLLIQEYDFINPDKDGNGCERKEMYKALSKEERIECRMKIGEVLVKIIQKLGEIAPFYRVPLTNVFFRVVRDDEPLIKASALSNLGELCHLLKFSLGSVLTEVWYNIESILSCEKEIHVRRAALHLLVLLLKGVEKEFSANHLLSDVQLGTYIRDARRLLTKVEEQEKDSVCKTHAQLALQELELIVRKLLRPADKLEFKIRVLDSFD